jgi:hypothetical protein
MPGDQRNQASAVQPHRTAIAQPECLVLPVTVFVWLYEKVVRTNRWWLKPVAMLVPIFGGGMATLIWVFMQVAVAQLIGIV